MAKTYDPAAIESEWYPWWEGQGLFKPTPAGASASKTFSMVLPPPNVTGALHIGHALTVAIQDALARYHRQTGASVLWVPGLDHAGIATQSVVERNLLKQEGLTRHDLGRDKFIDKVWEWKMQYGGRIVDQIRRVGASVDWSREAFTLDAPRSAAVTHAFVTLFEQGLVQRRSRLVNWCPHLRTAISDIEVDVVQLDGPTSMQLPGRSKPILLGVMDTFSYPLASGAGCVDVGTTRLETMLADVAVAVHPDDARLSGLIGQFVVHPVHGTLIPIVGDATLVDPALGTGAVKVTPAHDPNDFECGKRHGLPMVNMLNDDGTVNSVGGQFAGQDRFEVREALRTLLTSKGLYKGSQPNPMALATCSRSGDVLESLLKPQWYVLCTEGMSAAALEAGTSGELVFRPAGQLQAWERWLTHSQDWCVSRQLWWGHRVPAYRVRTASLPPALASTLLARCRAVGEGPSDGPSALRRVCVDGDTLWVVAHDAPGAVEALVQVAGDSDPGWCSPTARSALLQALDQDEDVLDTWFSSSLFPISVFGWPGKPNSPELQTFYPLSIMETGQDILFFWVARMAMMCKQLTGVIPFREVWLHPIVRDAQGRKMSKSLGNVVDPIDVINGTAGGGLSCGADALRMALLSYVQPSDNVQLNLDPKRSEHFRHFANKLWNASRFVLTHLAVPSSPATLSPVPTLPVGERWILSRLSHTVAAVHMGMATFDLSAASSAVYRFAINDFCEVYIEWSKLALSSPSVEADASKRVLATALDGLLRLLHPYMPFLAEELYQRLHTLGLEGAGAGVASTVSAPPSVMTASLEGFQAWGDAAVEAEVAGVLGVVRAARSLVKTTTDVLPDLGRKDIHFTVECSNAASRDALQRHVAHVAHLVRAGRVSVVAAGAGAGAGAASSSLPATDSVAGPTLVQRGSEEWFVMVRLPSDGATGEKLAAAASKVQRKLAKLEGNIAESARTVAALAGDPRIPQQAKDREAQRLATAQQEAQACRDTLAQLAGAGR